MNNTFPPPDDHLIRMILRSKLGAASADEEKLISAWAAESEERQLWLDNLTLEKLFKGAAEMSKIDAEVDEALKQVHEKIKQLKHE